MKIFAVQWLGAEGFVLHGFENGTELGQTGDIWPNQPGVIPQGLVEGLAGGGWLSLLGEPAVEMPLLAQVWTYPSDGSAARIVVEAPVTANTCGHDLLGQTVIRDADAADLTLAVPDCSAVGDFLVLKNLAQNTKLAAR